LLNDPIFLESAQALGRQIATLKDSDESRLGRIFVRLFNRDCDAEERADLTRFLAAQRNHYQKNPKAAEAIAGESAAGLPATEVAAWTVLARALLNTDEFVVHR
jgi:hypothetical protein